MLVMWSVVLLRESLNALEMVRNYIGKFKSTFYTWLHLTMVVHCNTPILVETCMDGMTQQKPYSK